MKRIGHQKWIVAIGVALVEICPPRQSHSNRSFIFSHFSFSISFGNHLYPSLFTVCCEIFLPRQVHRLNIGHPCLVDCYFALIMLCQQNKSFLFANRIGTNEESSWIVLLYEFENHFDGLWARRKFEDRVAKSVVQMQFLDSKTTPEIIFLINFKNLGSADSYLGMAAHITSVEIVLSLYFEQNHDGPCHMIRIKNEDLYSFVESSPLT